MGILQKIALVCFFISGAIALMTSLFLAEGAIAENYTDKTYVEPRFFSILVIWGIGAILFIIQRFKENLIFFIISFVLMLGSFPLGFVIAVYWTYKVSGQL